MTVVRGRLEGNNRLRGTKRDRGEKCVDTPPLARAMS